MEEKRSIRELRKKRKPLSGRIALRAWGGSSLAEKNKISGKSDPYLVFSLLQGNSKKEIKKTEVIHNTIDPRWNFDAFFIDVENDFPENSQLLVECFDWEKIGHHHHMGQVLFDLDLLEHDDSEYASEIAKFYPIQPHREGAEAYGFLHLVVSYTNSECWKDDKPKREEAKRRKKEEEIEKKRQQPEKQKKEEEQREAFIKEMQAKSRKEEARRMELGLDKVYTNKGLWPEDEERFLRYHEYEEYVALCARKGKKPLPKIEHSDYVDPYAKLDGSEVMKPLSQILQEQDANRSHDFDFLIVKK